MIIKQFKSGHPIGSSIDRSGPSGLTSNQDSQYYYYQETKEGTRYEWTVPKFSDATSFSNGHEKAPVCHIITNQYALELVVVWITLPLILGLVYLWKSSKRSGETPIKSNITSTSWLLVVTHSNLTCYFWIAYYIVDNIYKCTNSYERLPATGSTEVHNINNRSAIISVIGAISLGLAFIISAIAAIRNDMYYPDAQMSPREATKFINHLKATNPEMNIILKSHVRLTDHGDQLYDANTGRRVDISYIGYAGNPGADDWKRPKKSFEPANWSDGTMNYPDINDLVSSQRRTGTVSRSSTTYFTQSVMLKITLSINPQTESAGKDLNKCVFELARESGQRRNQSWISHGNDQLEDIVEEKYKLHATIPSSSYNSHFQDSNRRNGRQPLSVRWRGSSCNGFPMLTLERPIYIYVVPTRVNQGFSTETSTGLPFFIRFAWILNLIGCSGLVLLFLSVMHYPTITLKIIKTYGCRRLANDSLESNASGTTTSGQSTNTTNDNNNSGLVVNLAPATTIPEERISTRRSDQTNNHTISQLPMPPPYTSREPSISHHPMSPPPRYTSILEIDNVANDIQELHVDIPEEQGGNHSNSEANPQPPSYQEAISSQNNPSVENKL